MQMFDILIYAAIAVFLVFRLWSVLGQRGAGDDESPSRPNPFTSQESRQNDEENVMVLEGRARPLQTSGLTAAGHAPTSLAGTLDAIKATTAFDEKGFLEGAKAAFTGIVTAFAAGDMTSVAWLLGSAVLDPFQAAIADRKSRGETLENKIERFVAVDIVEAKLLGSVATLAVEFVTYQTNILKNAQGEVLEGNESKAEEIRDFWVFQRDLKAENPNWQLIETRT
ncbi:MAG: Tim44/TimA family putative adaptor protein [Alphaproteobacteria bacterium]|nr:Tim44/TimA family putative adaptor protein [Alphaproteobacteria bacterium]